MSATVGELSDTVTAAEVEWRIADYFSLPEKADEFYDSPGFFRFSGALWYLRIYPNGRRDVKTVGKIDIFIVRGDSGPAVTLAYKLGVKTGNGTQKTGVETTMTFEKNNRGWWGRTIFRFRSYDLAPSDVLTITCSLRQNVPKNLETRLFRDLDGLMLNGVDSDVTVRVKGEEFRLHRCILGARSPVFNSMFKHDMREKTTGIVTIDDCEADTFRVFLGYVYSGAVDKLSPENAFGLYQLADKYQVDELKLFCLEYMKNTPSVDMFFDAIALALTHDEKELMELVVDLLSDMMAEILMTVKWQNVLNEHPTQANGLLIKAAVRTKYKLSLCHPLYYKRKKLSDDS